MFGRSVAGLALAASLAIAGCSGGTAPASPVQVEPSAAASPARFNELIDIGGGRKLHLFCYGEAAAGVATVVAESGLGEGVDAWPSEIRNRVAAKTRFCAYDRAGLGTSDPAPEPVRTSQDMADDLNALLTAAKIEGPYLFVPHSMGIWNVVLYAKAHPENVRGVVVLDPRGAEVSAQWLAALPPATPDEVESIAANRSELTDFESDPTQNDDHLDLVAASREAGAAMDPPDLLFGDKPVVVLSAANTPDSWNDLPKALKDEFDRIWFDAQRAIAAESSNGTFKTVENSEHFIQEDQPGTVVTEILKLVDATAS